MSRWAATCRLLASVTERDGYGVAHETLQGTEVPCNVYSMGDAAYFAAAAAGIKPQATLQVRAAEYGGQALVEFEGTVYAVERVNRSSPDFVTITLVERVGDRG